MLASRLFILFVLQTQRMIDGMKNRGETAEDFRDQEGAVIQHYQV
jgi:hypothetical protein